jgi:pilus assembly protein CpaF
LQVLLQVRRAGGDRVLESVCLLLPSGPERLVTAVPAWTRERGSGPAAPALAALIAERGVPVPPLLATAAGTGAATGRRGITQGAA